jgi:hypothetical protein
MGNAITKKVDLGKEFEATAGFDQLWQIWSGRNKEDGSEVSIWTFDKVELGKRQQAPITDKSVQEQLYMIMKKDFQAMREIESANFIRVLEVSKIIALVLHITRLRNLHDVRSTHSRP